MKLLSSFQFEDVQGYKLGSSYFGAPKMFVHSFFVDGLLIDTGQSNIRKEYMEAISNFHIDQVFITHHHEDHTGVSGGVAILVLLEGQLIRLGHQNLVSASWLATRDEVDDIEQVEGPNNGDDHRRY